MNNYPEANYICMQYNMFKIHNICLHYIIIYNNTYIYIYCIYIYTLYIHFGHILYEYTLCLFMLAAGLSYVRFCVFLADGVGWVGVGWAKNVQWH